MELQHLDHLIGVIVLMIFIGCWKTYAVHHRDWCGPKLWPSVLLLNAIPVVPTMIVYYKLLSILDVYQWGRYAVLAYLPAGVLAEIAAGRLRPKAPQLGESTDRELPALPVIRRITKKKLEVARRLQERADCRQLLEEALELSDLPTAKAVQLRRKLSQPPSRTQVIGVVNAVGLSHIKTFVQGDTTWAFLRKQSHLIK